MTAVDLRQRSRGGGFNSIGIFANDAAANTAFPNAAVGQVYYNSTTSKYKIKTALSPATWQDIDAVAGPKGNDGDDGDDAMVDRSNVYAQVKDIIEMGTGIQVADDDTAETVTVTATGGVTPPPPTPATITSFFGISADATPQGSEAYRRGCRWRGNNSRLHGIETSFNRKAR